MLYRVLLPLLLLAAVQGCDAATPCDPNQRFEGSVCKDQPPGPGAGGSSSGGNAAVVTGVDAGTDASADPGTDAGADAGADADGAATGCTQALPLALGVACSAAPECGCAAPYCAITPGQTVGYCTTPDCDPQGDDCPSGYQCFDLSSLGVIGVPTFCVRP